MPDGRELNIVDEQGNIVGVETRENIHKQGLLHREIHVWFYTPKGEIIFQHRAKDKDTFPDLLDATVAGHVEIGEDYKDTALKEMQEEAGIAATADNLAFIQMIKINAYDAATGTSNNTIKAVYAYRYDGKIGDLKIEEGKGVGFEVWPLEKIFNIGEEDRKKFIPAMLEPTILGIFRKIEAMLPAQK